ncbi:MAG: T9SS type A sorting domain-containing protein, partial [Candidatus Kapabacteria bacterium]|nr:T9SS type A sorting domain-containing protein [Candidatus Kapabacteria bacterium]
SPTWSFSTTVRPPKLISPIAGATGVVQALLEWERVSDALAYGIEVSTSPSFKPLVTKLDGIQDTAILIRGLENNKRYFWRVRSADADAVGLFSDRQSFTTGLLSSVDVDEAFSTESVEPNPASETIRIHLDSTLIGSVVTIEVVNSEGRLMKSVITGDEIVTVNVNELAVGTYTVRIRSGSITERRRLVVKR